MKMGQTPFWNNFGTVDLKTEILEHRPGTPGGFFMPSSGAAHPQSLIYSLSEVIPAVNVYNPL